MPQISSSAIVEKGAKLAADVTVGPYCYIGPEVKIGPGCVLQNSVTIVGKTTVGEKNHFFPMSVIGTQENAGGQTGRVMIGNANTIREHATIHSSPDRETRIGTNNLIMIASIIGAGAWIADHGIFDNCSHIGANAQIGDYVRTSGFATVGDGMSVGAYTFVTGYTHVDRPAPPFAMLQGVPMRVRGVNTRNLKRCGFSDDDIRTIKMAFRDLFNNNGRFVNEEAIKRLGGSENPHIRLLVESVETDQTENES